MWAIIIAVLLATSSPAVKGTWYEHYERGVRLVRDGKALEGRGELKAALALRPQEGLQVVTRPERYLDYLPHLYLGIASQMLGDVAEARRELGEAQKSGLASRSEIGQPLMVAYDYLLHDNSKSPRPPYAVFPARPGILSDSEFSKLRRDVMRRCDVPEDSKLDIAPWYARYELGLELEKRGDYSRALTELIEAVGDRPNPHRRARMYGMWLIDYYPYFHIAQSHVKLGNWSCARNALDVSQRLGEIPATAPEFNEFQRLQQEAARNLLSRP